MKLILSTIIFFSYLLSAQSQDFRAFATQYKPSKISFDLPSDVVDQIDQNNPSDIDIVAFNIIYLKQYLHHLKCCNQSYNLEGLFNDKTRVFLDAYVRHNNLVSQEGISSRAPYEIVINDPSLMKSRDLKKLVNCIQKEEKRIKKN